MAQATQRLEPLGGRTSKDYRCPGRNSLGEERLACAGNHDYPRPTATLCEISSSTDTLMIGDALADDAEAAERTRPPSARGSIEDPTHDEQAAQKVNDESAPPFSSAADRLDKANRAAIDSLPSSPTEALVVPCSLTGELACLRLRVVGEDGRPLARQKVELVDGAPGTGRRARTQTDNAGEAEFRGLLAGPYRLSLYGLDRDAWELLAGQGRAATASVSEELSWTSATGADAASPNIHEVKQGECIASIAARLGLLPETLWEASENAELRGKRGTGYVLFPGDRLHVPAPRRRDVDVLAGQSVQLRRKGIPEVLKLRFQNEDGLPHRDLTYMLALEVATGAPPANVTGVLGADGMLVEGIPPDATLATVTLDPDGLAQTFEFALGHMDPITEVSGVQGRLNNLGFPCGPVDGDCGEKTRAAIAAFGAAHGLKETGDPRDPAFLRTLGAAHVS